MKNQNSIKLMEHCNLLFDLAHRRTFWFVLLLDIALILTAHILAYAIRFELTIVNEVKKIIAILPIIVLIKVPVFHIFGLYRGMWRFTSFADVRNIAKAVTVSSGILIFLILYFNRFHGFSRSVFILDAVFSFLLISFHRGFIRYLLQENFFLSRFQSNGEFSNNKRCKQKRLLLIGAGSPAEKIIREIKETKKYLYDIVGIIDDDKSKIGLKIHGVPVLGTVSSLGLCIEKNKIDEILIAVASAASHDIRKFVSACRDTGIHFKILPSLSEIIQGNLSVTKSREVDYKDLLGRPVVKLDHQEIGGYLTGKSVLVTGAGGSIGSELCRQLLNYEPDRIILLDTCEANLYTIQMELEHEYHYENHVTILGNCGNLILMKSIFNLYSPVVVFHAAAYKHVPLVETNPWEGVANNVAAFKDLFYFAIANNVDRFVLVSSDKAVRPTNIMGVTKRITELIMHTYCLENKQAESQKKMKCMAVRFGNVLGSSGSVIPLFKKQIEGGGPVTVTDKKVTRYFMAIEEAAQLILQAGAMGENGEIFLLKMGDAIKIDDLARDLITLMGKTPESEIEIKYTGLRPGEKLYEELITKGEGVVPTVHKKIMVLSGMCGGVDYDTLERLFEAASLCDGKQIRKLVKQIVPEYSPTTNNVFLTDKNDKGL